MFVRKTIIANQGRTLRKVLKRHCGIWLKVCWKLNVLVRKGWVNFVFSNYLNICELIYFEFNISLMASDIRIYLWITF